MQIEQTNQLTESQLNTTDSHYANILLYNSDTTRMSRWSWCWPSIGASFCLAGVGWKEVCNGAGNKVVPWSQIKPSVRSAILIEHVVGANWRSGACNTPKHKPSESIPEDWCLMSRSGVPERIISCWHPMLSTESTNLQAKRVINWLLYSLSSYSGTCRLKKSTHTILCANECGVWNEVACRPAEMWKANAVCQGSSWEAWYYTTRHVPAPGGSTAHRHTHPTDVLLPKDAWPL